MSQEKYKIAPAMASFREIIKTLGPREQKRTDIRYQNRLTRRTFFTPNQLAEHARIRLALRAAYPKATTAPDEYLTLRNLLEKDAEKAGLVFPSSEIFEREMLVQHKATTLTSMSVLDISIALDRMIDGLPILSYLSDYFVPEGWDKLFTEAQEELLTVSNYLVGERKTNVVVPNNQDVFRAFYFTPLNKVRVVIMGQDPYPSVLEDGRPVACGMCFATRPGVPVQKSLQVIYENLRRTYPWYPIPAHGDLTYWARQGVLLLNSSLTCTKDCPGSHAGRWNGFLRRLIELLLINNKHTIFVMWGNYAKNIRSEFLRNRGYAIEGIHPASRGEMVEKFLSVPFFEQINKILVSEAKSTPIDWTIPLDPRQGYTIPLHTAGTVERVMVDLGL